LGARHIDLPRDFSQTFEEPIAEAWSQTILKQVRSRTKEFADDCIGLVEQMVAWAREQGTRVQPKLIEAQQEAIRTDAKQLASVGREVVNDLRDRVKEDLVKAIEGPIRKKCRAFVERNADVGTGVKNRILDLFDELADEAIESATAPAKRVLLENYRTVEREIREIFKAHQNPLESAESALVSSHEDYVKRSDAQKRNLVLREIERIIEDRPELFELPDRQVAEV
jgi:gas vesicle protein